MQPYKKLFTFWFSVILYDRGVEFCNRWIKVRKLWEQMVGALRSNKQNIVEGADNLKTSLKVAIKLTGIAKGSLEEFIGDVEDFVRQRGLAVWGEDDPRVLSWRAQSARLVRNLSVLSNLRDEALRYQKEAELLSQLPLPPNPEAAANFLLTLGHQASYLLNRQVDGLMKKHEKEGGLTEKLYRNRIEERKRQARIGKVF